MYCPHRRRYTSLAHFLSAGFYLNPYDGQPDQRSMTNVEHWGHNWDASYAGAVRTLRKHLRAGRCVEGARERAGACVVFE